MPYLVTSLQRRVGQNIRYREQRSPVVIPSHQPTGESGSAWQVQRAALTSCQSLSSAYKREWISMAGTESSAHQLPVLVTSLQERVGQHGRYREQRSPVVIPSHQPTGESGSARQVRRAALTSCQSLSSAYRREWVSMAGTESSAHQLPFLVTSLQERVGQHGSYREQRSPVAIANHQPTEESGSVGMFRKQPSLVAIPSH